SSGTFQPGVTAPNPLLAPDILQLTTSANKTFGAGAFINQSGTVEWLGGNVFTGNNAIVLNQSLWDVQDTFTLAQFSGSGSFTNSGIYRMSGSDGFHAISTGGLSFINSGVIDVVSADASINFSGNNKTFNSGSSFTGAGRVTVTGNSTFAGDISSGSLVIVGGTQTGNAATLFGTARWEVGTLNGSWTVASGSTLTAAGGANKFIGVGAEITNAGTFAMVEGNVLLTNAAVTNAGLFDMQGNNNLGNFGGNIAATSFTNDGTLRKSGGDGVSTVTASTMRFINNGVIEVVNAGDTLAYSGNQKTFNDGTSFIGAGQVTVAGNSLFQGTIASENLVILSNIQTGNAATLVGTARWEGGTLSGDWTIAAGTTLTLAGAANKFIGSGSSFANEGTMVWQGGDFRMTNSDVVNAGTITILGNNTLGNFGGTARTFVNQGLIEKTEGGGTTTLGDSVISIANQGAINVHSGTIAFVNNFSNAGTLGGTGTFAVGGTTGLTNNGTIAPGAPGETGTLSLTGNYVQTALGAFALDIASTSAFDLFQVSGTASLSGLLSINCILMCNISDGDSFTFLTSGGALSGMFSGVEVNGFLPGFVFGLVHGSNFVRLDILSAGMAPPPPEGVIPEPATWAMLIAGFGLVGVASRRRRQKIGQA
ncbi:MAG: PEPxxWA-CTERM sorting domain-containing protein, partial [Sphingomonadaceae bacterium]